jgi:hypothetical protein
LALFIRFDLTLFFDLIEFTDWDFLLVTLLPTDADRL